MHPNKIVIKIVKKRMLDYQHINILSNKDKI